MRSLSYEPNRDFLQFPWRVRCPLENCLSFTVLKDREQQDQSDGMVCEFYCNAFPISTLLIPS